MWKGSNQVVNNHGRKKLNRSGSDSSNSFHALQSILQRQDMLMYQKSDLIGKGTYGEVYKALDQNTGGLFAVKCITISSKLSTDERIQELRNIENEIINLQSLKHPNIVKYISSKVIDNDRIEIVLEWVPGGSIKHIMRKFGSFQTNLNLVRNYTYQILKGLQYLHE